MYMILEEKETEYESLGMYTLYDSMVAQFFNNFFLYGYLGNNSSLQIVDCSQSYLDNIANLSFSPNCSVLGIHTSHRYFAFVYFDKNRENYKLGWLSADYFKTLKKGAAVDLTQINERHDMHGFTNLKMDESFSILMASLNEELLLVFYALNGQQQIEIWDLHEGTLLSHCLLFDMQGKGKKPMGYYWDEETLCIYLKDKERDDWTLYLWKRKAPTMVEA
jgi:hypothetical protein